MFDFTDLNFDFDGDGVLDSHVDFIDSDGDGTMDTAVLDADGDGTMDTVVLDTDGDGIFDAFMSAMDQDDFIETAGIDFECDSPPDGYPSEFHGDFEGSASATCISDLTNFDPAEADMSKVSGNPAPSMQEWEYQGDTGRCALYSQKFVIEELTDMEIEIEEMADLAESNGWFSEEGGTPLLDMDKILEHYGIHSDMSFHNDFSDLQRELEAGKKVIVSIDADEIWYGEEDGLFTPGDGANHAVEVIGVDHSDPESPMVILNDSGSPQGCGEMVPLDTFVDAWEDGNCQMISCM